LIKVFFEDSSTCTIQARSFAGLYFLPWNIEGVKSYNPLISILFERFLGNEPYATEEKRRLYHNLAREIYYSECQTAFTWDNFKVDYPTQFSLMENTFIPRRFSFFKTAYSGYFNSLRLPAQVEFHALLPVPITSSRIHRYKQYEDTLAQLFKNENVVLNALVQSESRIVFNTHEMETRGKRYFKSLSKYYPPLDTIKPEGSHLMSIYSDNVLTSKWMLLPGERLALVAIESKVIKGDEIKWNGFTAQVSGLRRSKSMLSVFILFDRFGSMIHNSGETHRIID
jgi:hypothetical protein